MKGEAIVTEIPTHAQTLREDFDKWFRRACLGQDTDAKDSNQ